MQMGPFATCPVSLRVSSVHILLLFWCHRHKTHFSGNIVIFSYVQWQSSCSKRSHDCRACRRLTPLHSCFHQQMLLNPFALLRLMNRRQVPEGKHARRQVSSQLSHLACAPCRHLGRNTHVRARICRHVGNEFNPVSHTSRQRPCAVLSTCVTFPMRCAPTWWHLKRCIIQSRWME